MSFLDSITRFWGTAGTESAPLFAMLKQAFGVDSKTSERVPAFTAVAVTASTGAALVPMARSPTGVIVPDAMSHHG